MKRPLRLRIYTFFFGCPLDNDPDVMTGCEKYRYQGCWACGKQEVPDVPERS